MYFLNKLPKDYKYLHELNICSNKIIGGGFPFAIGQALPLIIGYGSKPQIWLQAVNPVKPDFPIVLIDSNIPTNKDISLFEYGDNTNKLIKVKVRDILLLEVKIEGPNRATVSYMDLRPIGLNIIGDSDSLRIGSSSFSNNTIKGTKVFINLD